MLMIVRLCYSLSLLLLLLLLTFYGRYLYWREEYIHTQSYRKENEGVLSGALVQGYRCREHFCRKEGRKGQKHQSTAVSVSLDITHVHAYSHLSRPTPPPSPAHRSYRRPWSRPA